jgi:hypothetical protein
MQIGALARKCSNFFDWLSNSHSDSLAELLWKNEMIIYASELYPELNNNELARLVDRDWKYMPEAERNVNLGPFRKYARHTVGCLLRGSFRRRWRRVTRSSTSD